MNNFDNLRDMIEKAQEKAFFYNKDILKILFQDAKTNKEKAIFLIAIGIVEGKKYHNDGEKPCDTAQKTIASEGHNKDKSFYHW